jgi:hypothetical protein
MRKLTATLLLAATLTMIGPQMAQAQGLGYVCNDWHANIQPAMGFEKVHNRVLWLIRCATDRWDVPGGYAQMVAIATRESGPYTWPWAENPSGSSGVFQIIGSTYASWRAAFADRVRMARLVDSVFNARTNVLLAVWAANAYGLGAWGF